MSGHLPSMSTAAACGRPRGWQVDIAEQDDRKRQRGLELRDELMQFVRFRPCQVASYEFTTLTCVPGVFNYKVELGILYLQGLKVDTRRAPRSSYWICPGSSREPRMAKAVESRRFCIAALSWKAVFCRACFCQVISVAYSCSLILIEAASASPQFRCRLLQVPHLQRASKVFGCNETDLTQAQDRI